MEAAQNVDTTVLFKTFFKYFIWEKCIKINSVVFNELALKNWNVNM